MRKLSSQNYSYHSGFSLVMCGFRQDRALDYFEPVPTEDLQTIAQAKGPSAMQYSENKHSKTHGSHISH